MAQRGRPIKKRVEDMTLTEQAQEILRIAQRHGVEQNFFFITTFKRYQVQVRVLQDLEKIINDDGLVVSKEYVKGRKNVYSHPAIKDYNRTTDSANKTVAVLLKIIRDMRSAADDPEDDPLLKVLNGGSMDGLNDEPDDLAELDDIDEEDDDDDDEEPTGE